MTPERQRLKKGGRAKAGAEKASKAQMQTIRAK